MRRKTGPYARRHERKCQYSPCGKEFRSVKPSARYCCQKCGDRAWSEANREDINAKRTKRRRLKEIVQKACALCGDLFPTKRDDARFCSKKCAHSVWQKLNKERIYERDRPLRVHSHRRRKYGLSETAFNSILAAQNNKCAVCKKEFKEGEMIAIDHCHLLGHVRGLLHRWRNSALGHLNTPEILRRAADYLERDALIYPLEKAS